MITERIQTDICRAITGERFFEGAEVVDQLRGDVQSAVDAALGKRSICVVVEILKGRMLYPAAGPHAVEFSGAITVTENVQANRSAEQYSTAWDYLENLYMVFNPAARQAECVLGDFEVVNDVGGKLVIQIPFTVQAGWQRTNE